MVNFKYYNTGASFDSTSLLTDDIAFVEDNNSLFTHGKEYKFITDAILNTKQDVLTAGINIKTVNGQSLLGGGNITIQEGGAAVQTAITGTSVTQVLSPNVYYSFGTVTSLTMTLDTPVSGVNNEYIFEFDSGSTATTLSIPASVVGIDTTAIKVNKHYEISIKYDVSNQNYYGLIQEW